MTLIQKVCKSTRMVREDTNQGVGTLGDFKYNPATKGSSDYSYDSNGNLPLDNNKQISSITYNYKNLPQVITITGEGTSLRLSKNKFLCALNSRAHVFFTSVCPTFMGSQPGNFIVQSYFHLRQSYRDDAELNNINSLP